jgi:HSP20 family molecular chaperone IbpA
MTWEESLIRKFKLNDVVVFKDKRNTRIYRVVGFSRNELSIYLRCRECNARDRFLEDLFELYTGNIPDDLPMSPEVKGFRQPHEDIITVVTTGIAASSIKIIVDENSSVMRAIKRGDIVDTDKYITVEVYVKKILRHDKRKCELIATTGQVTLVK